MDSNGNFEKNDWARCNDYCSVWQKLGSKSYLVVSEKKNYMDATLHCLNNEAKLVLAKDKKVNAFVKKIAREMDISEFWDDDIHDKKMDGQKPFICVK